MVISRRFTLKWSKRLLKFYQKKFKQNERRNIIKYYINKEISNLFNIKNYLKYFRSEKTALKN